MSRSSNSLTNRLIVIITATLVVFVGLSTLFGLIVGDTGYRIPDFVPVVGNLSGSLPTGKLAFLFVRIAVVTIAFGVIIGVINLVAVNAQRAFYGKTVTAKLNSAVILIFFVLGIIAPVFNPTFSDFLLENVQTTIESSLAALIFFALVYGAFRILRHKVTFSGILFVLTVELILIGGLPVQQFAPIQQLTNWVINVPVNAGARGILLGIALATVITGLRILLGQDRTYGE